MSDIVTKMFKKNPSYVFYINIYKLTHLGGLQNTVLKKQNILVISLKGVGDLNKSKTHYEKGSFLDHLASMTPNEINDFLRTNGKSKPVNPFIRIDPRDRFDQTTTKQEDKDYGNQ